MNLNDWYGYHAKLKIPTEGKISQRGILGFWRSGEASMDSSGMRLFVRSVKKVMDVF